MGHANFYFEDHITKSFLNVVMFSFNVSKVYVCKVNEVKNYFKKAEQHMNHAHVKVAHSVKSRSNSYTLLSFYNAIPAV